MQLQMEDYDRSFSAADAIDPSQDLYSPTSTLFDPLSPTLLGQPWQFETLPLACSGSLSDEMLIGSFFDGMASADSFQTFTSFPASLYPFYDTCHLLPMALPDWSGSTDAVLFSASEDRHAVQTPDLPTSDLPAPKQEMNDLIIPFTDDRGRSPTLSDLSVTETDSKQDLDSLNCFEQASPTPSDSTLYLRPTKRSSAPTEKKCHFPGCTRIFTKFANLKAHIATHTGIRDFRCSTCSATFTTKNRLVVHERVHTNEKPYACNVLGCSYAARQKCALTSHMITHLTAEEKEALKEQNQRTLPCDECGRLYKNQESLSQHMWKKHKKPLNLD